MATTLPVPIEFQLPQGWQSTPPDEVGASGVAFVAVHPQSQNDFVANITISGELRPADVPLAAMADEAIAKLGAATDVTLASRQVVGTEQLPSLTQVLTVGDGTEAGQRLLQCQVYLTLPDPVNTDQRAVVELAMTATESQLDQLVGDFEHLVRTVRPGQDDAPSE